MLCPKCGRETESGGRYCQWCGGDLKVAPPRAVLRKRVGEITTEKYAGLPRRIGAGFLDIIVLLFLDILVAGLFSIVSWMVQKPNPLSEAVVMLYQYYRHLPRTDAYGNVVRALVPNQVILFFGILLLVVPWLYFAYLESSSNQATLGKMVMRIAVTDMRGNRITFARASLRFLCIFLSVLTIFIGFLIPAFTRYKQGLHDMIAGTLMFLQEY
jgi:uncharacterized RDD family membrane protein YckC